MIIKTSRFGELDVNPDKILHFPTGMPGFEKNKRFFLIEYRERKFNWLQSVEDPNLAFIVCDPDVLSLHYEVPSSIRKQIGVFCEDDLSILVIVRVERKKQEVAPLVRAPLVFNTKTRQGIQWILD